MLGRGKLPPGLVYRQSAENRPSTFIHSGGNGGRAPLVKADGGRSVEGRNYWSTHASFCDALRSSTFGGAFQARPVGWRSTLKKSVTRYDTDYSDSLNVGTCFGTSDKEFKDALRSLELRPMPRRWKERAAKRQVAPTRSMSLSASAPGGLFPSGHSYDPSSSAVREELRSRLRIKHGSVLGGWRALDPLGQGKLSFADFCKGIRALGNIHDIKGLWEALDKDNNGFVGVQDLDPDLSHLLMDFKEFLFEACGSAEAAWQEHFCPSIGYGKETKGRCAPKTFAQAARALGYNGPIAEVFKALDVDKAPGGISHKEFVALDKWFHLRSTQRRQEGAAAHGGPGGRGAGFGEAQPDFWAALEGTAPTSVKHS